MLKLSSLRALQTTLEYVLIKHRIINNSKELTEKMKTPPNTCLEKDYRITQEHGMLKLLSLWALQTTLECVLIKHRIIKNSKELTEKIKPPLIPLLRKIIE